MKGRTANNPTRRIAHVERCSPDKKAEMCRLLHYVGSANHKKRPGDYKFHPQTNPRPSKSLCDEKREVLSEEAVAMLRDGLTRGLFSDFEEGGVPKFVWSVDNEGEVFEAKTHPAHERSFHGYRLSDDDDMKRIVLREWKKRCPENSQ